MSVIYSVVDCADKADLILSALVQHKLEFGNLPFTLTTQ